MLKSLHKKSLVQHAIDVDNFKKTDKILDALRNKSPVSRKTTLSALVVLTNNDKYRQQMLLDIKEHTKHRKAKKSQRQLKNSISQEEIKTL